MNKQVFLILQNGNIFKGKSIGKKGITAGEIVFNTSMSGYQEILTDPSYKNQIIAFTYPHIGNTGINNIDIQSHSIQANGMIIHNLSLISSHYQSLENLSNYLKNNNIIGISEIDTRKLTRILRTQGSQYGCILNNNTMNINLAEKYIKNAIQNSKKKIIQKISTPKIYNWLEGNFIKKNISDIKKKKLLKIIVYDFGVKYNILKILIDYKCDVIVVPSETTIKKILSINPDGIILSNGPGDPRLYINIINIIKNLLKTKIPILGICLGHQLLALANKAKIIKMKFGHHGSNHPVQNIKTKKVFITTQNHNFTINKKNLPKNIIITHKSLFDNTIQGIYIPDKNCWGFQGHPEANPGPNDSKILFKKFIQNIKKLKRLI